MEINVSVINICSQKYNHAKDNITDHHEALQVI